MRMIPERVAFGTVNYRIMLTEANWPSQVGHELFRSREDADREIENLKAVGYVEDHDNQYRLFVKETLDGIEIGPCPECLGNRWVVDQPDENEASWEQVDCTACHDGRVLYRVKPTSPVTQIEGE